MCLINVSYIDTVGRESDFKGINLTRSHQRGLPPLSTPQTVAAWGSWALMQIFPDTYKFFHTCQVMFSVQVPHTWSNTNSIQFQISKMIEEIQRYKAQDYYTYKDYNLHSLTLSGSKTQWKLFLGIVEVLQQIPSWISHLWLSSGLWVTVEKGMLLVVIWKLQSNQGQLKFKLEEGRKERGKQRKD